MYAHARAWTYTHIHAHTRTHTHFVLNPCHIEVSNNATSVDGTNHLVSKRLQSPVSTHNCAVCVNNKNVVKADWNSFKALPLVQVPRPQLGPHVRANKKLPHRRRRQTVKACPSARYPFPVQRVRQFCGKPNICTRLIDKGLGLGLGCEKPRPHANNLRPTEPTNKTLNSAWACVGAKSLAIERKFTFKVFQQISLPCEDSIKIESRAYIKVPTSGAELS